MRLRSAEVRRCGVALLLLVVLAAPVCADDPDPTAPPEARINPPIGSSSVTPPEAPGFFAQLIEWICLYARISPPIG